MIPQKVPIRTPVLPSPAPSEPVMDVAQEEMVQKFLQDKPLEEMEQILTNTRRLVELSEIVTRIFKMVQDDHKKIHELEARCIAIQSQLDKGAVYGPARQ